MIHFMEIPNISTDAREILEIHLNKMLMTINSFMIAMAKGLVPFEQLPPGLKKSPLIKDPSWAFPIGIRKSKNAEKEFTLLVKKVFDEDNFYDLSLNEKYVLAKVITVGIQQEENAISKLLENDDSDRFNEWIYKYRIENEENRRIVLEELKKSDNMSSSEEEYLIGKGMKYRNKVVKAIGERELIRYEYPFALTSLFSDMEWGQIMTMQEFEEIIKKENAK